MNRVETQEKPIPKSAEHRLADLLSDTSSPETKAGTARWYVEMFIDTFLSSDIKEKIGIAQFRKLSLGEMIQSIGESFGAEMRSSLLLIKNFGDRASHYNPSSFISHEDAEKVVSTAIDLFALALIHELKTNPLNSASSRATIFSTIFPSVRERVLRDLMVLSDPLDEYNAALLHKYCLACTKNGNVNKARRKLDELRKKNFIDEARYYFEVESIRKIQAAMQLDMLPIPKRMEDCARNFEAVVGDLSAEEAFENSRLIELIQKLLDQVSSSDMLHYAGGQVYAIENQG
ncbi:hypothetical protein ACOCG7_05950 [Paraburkholderia sp. DD10]|uniref:hypothetical protein n=1 Tax=Paraburkholderia sp. DD10 TaxID=3409691 RepID=UPI003BA26FD1